MGNLQLTYLVHAFTLAALHLLAMEVACQSTEKANMAQDAAAILPKKDTLEETVFAEMLRIVDGKFDSLSERISVLERSVNSLNFYSIRQFREITETVEATSRGVENMESHLGEIETDNRAMKLSLSQIGRDVSTMRLDTAKMFDDIANSIVYSNQHVEEKTKDLKVQIDKAAQAAAAAAAAAASRSKEDDTAILIKYLEERHQVNCSVNFRPLEERIDLRFAEMKRQTHTHFVDLINAASTTSEDADNRQDQGVDEPVIDEGGVNKRGEKEANGKEGERVMMMLANMTQNVMDAVAYFRHTAGMIERVLANSDTLVEEQARLRYDLLEASGLLTDGTVRKHHGENFKEGTQSEFTNKETLPQDYEDASANDLDPQMNSVETSSSRDARTSPGRPQSPHSESTRVRTPSFTSKVTGGTASLQSCPLPLDSLKVLANLAKNGTQLLDVLTDLAQMSGSSLSLAVGSLHDEVVRLEFLRSRLTESLVQASSKTSSGAFSTSHGESQELRSLQNITKTIFTIVEAVASNTGWIPYIFHNMQHVERMVNRTLELVQRSLSQRPWSRPHSNEVPASLEAQDHFQMRGDDEPTAFTKTEAFNVVLDTNVKLKRIIPALTRMLAESEPLIALVDGKTHTEGRVEIFYKGHWGSVCRGSMGHLEASSVCRHLGYAGGVWAGSGHFGLGNGLQWRFNVSCLSLQPCPVVHLLPPNTDCSHADDFSIICDHMVRVLPIPGVNDVNTGRIEMHHLGFWLPICARGWSGYEARVACKQLGFRDGREYESPALGVNSTAAWITGVGCLGKEPRLDACKIDSFDAQSCPDNSKPAAVRCQ